MVEDAFPANGLAELLPLFEIASKIMALRDYKRYSLREEVNYVFWRQW